MRRRGFLGFLGASTAAVASGASLGSTDQTSRGITISGACSNERCQEPFSLFVDLTGPFPAGAYQCPRCLYVLDLGQGGVVADQIAAWNEKHAKWNGNKRRAIQ